MKLELDVARLAQPAVWIEDHYSMEAAAARAPRVRCGLGSRMLACGCLVGVYETYENRVVTIVDARGLSCAETAHRSGSVIAHLPGGLP